MSGKEHWPVLEEVLPHRAPMLLIDSITHFSTDVLQSQVRIDERAMFFVPGSGVPVWVGIEYMAQTTAALIGCEMKQRGEPTKIGFLLGARRFAAYTDYFRLAQKLTIVSKRVLEEGEIGQFDCEIYTAGDVLLARSKINAYLPQNSAAFFSSQGL